MTFDEFMGEVLKIFPQAYVGEDNGGQIVIYTNLYQTKDNNVEAWDDAKGGV